MNTPIISLARTLGRIGLVLGLSGLLLLSLSLLLRLPGPAQAWSLGPETVGAVPAASIRYVAVEGTDAGNNCTISTNPCATVQRAVDVAAFDDEIRVAAGTYSGVLVRQSITQVVYISQSVTIRGGYTTTNWTTSDPGTYATILDAQGQGRVIFVDSVSITLAGLQLTGGNTRNFANTYAGANAQVGGGVYLISSPHALITGCQIYSNTAQIDGGGAYAWHGAVVIANSSIFDNAADRGGGIRFELYMFDRSASLIGNHIYHNTAFSDGGGLYMIMYNNPDVLVSANVFSQNMAGANGGGVHLNNGRAYVSNNQFISNTASGEGGGAHILLSSDTLMHNTFVGNTAGSEGGGVYWGGGASTLAQNTFSSNSSGSYGGGVSVSYGPAVLIENYFEHNYASAGGAVQAWDVGVLTMTANVLMSNTARIGGGLAFHAEQGQSVLTENVFAENKATIIGGGTTFDTARSVEFSRNIISGNINGGVLLNWLNIGALTNNAFLNNTGYALMMGDGDVTATHNTIISNTGGITLANFGSAPELTLINTILAKNGVGLEASAGTTTTLDGVLWFGNSVNTTGSGYITIGQQITANPLLAADGYHLQTGSPAIDAGVPSGVVDDIDGELRPSGPAVDIGADEWLYPNTAELSVTQQVLPLVVHPNESVTYTIAYRNLSGVATGTVISASLPAGLTDLNVISSGAVLTTMPGMTYTWQVADLPSGTGGLITITAVVMPGLAPQVLTSTVSITASQSDFNPANNTANAVLTIANRAPVANAGPDQNAMVSALVMLDGGASVDPDGHLPLSYEWQQAGGVPIMLSNNTISRPTFIAPSVPSILRFSLDVTDSFGLRSVVAATTVVTVTDRPVTNLWAANDSPTILGRETMFVATADGSNIIYTWNFGDNTTAIGKVLTHTYALSGTYTAVVTASNGSGSVMVTSPVTITNRAPVAAAGSDQNVLVSSLVDLDGGGSYDQDGHVPLAYQWTQAGGPVVLLNSTVVSRPTFAAPATQSLLTFTLRVTDTYGLASAIDTTVIRVNDEVITGLLANNNSPIKVGHSVNFTATLSAGSNVIYQWNFGDGIASDPTNLLTATHVYTRYGSFPAVVTATNQSGLATAETLVVVRPHFIYIPLMRKDS